MNAEPIRHSAKPGPRPPGSRPISSPWATTLGALVVLIVCAPFWLAIGYAIWWLA